MSTHEFPVLSTPDQAITRLERPAIWGGEFADTRLVSFLQAWQPWSRNMPWRICEWVSDLGFEYETTGLPAAPEFLERVHYFGSGGDLALRRDRARWLWHYVGLEGTTPPLEQSGVAATSYWDAPDHGWSRLELSSRHVLLWGQKRGPAGAGSEAIFWQEDRVAGVRRPLQYKGPWDERRPDRVQLRYWAFLHDGNVEAVWWLGLEAAEVV
jgi:hypothetical protein